MSDLRVDYAINVEDLVNLLDGRTIEVKKEYTADHDRRALLTLQIRLNDIGLVRLIQLLREMPA